jgi:hypothetical protein
MRIASLPRARARRLGALAAVAVVACGVANSPSVPAPIPRSVVPSAGYTGRDVSIRISGENFLARLKGGQLDTTQRAWLDDTELSDVTWVDAQTLTATVPAQIAPGVKALRVENAYGVQGTLAAAFTAEVVPSGLAAAIATDRATANPGQQVGVTFTVNNWGTGGATVTAVVPSATGAGASCGVPSPAPPVDLAAGASQVFRWWCTGAAAGVLVLDGAAAGTDDTTGEPITAGAVASGQVQVQAPASLAVLVSVDGSPSAVTVGQGFTLRLALSNAGGAATEVTAATVTPLEAGCGAPAPALPQTLAGGASLAVTFPCAAIAVGNLAPAASVRGTDSNSGSLLATAQTLAPAMPVKAPAALTAAIAAQPVTLAAGQRTSVIFTVTNGTSSPAATVTSVASWATGSGGATCTFPTVPHGIDIPAGASRSFAWTCTASAAGSLLLGGTLNYTAGKAHLSASPAVPLAVTVTQ